jgi:hypothetical protein
MNTMRVKPYAMSSPSRNARHTALCAPGGCMSTSGCSCRYRSSLLSWSGGPGGTSCTGQYRYPVSGQRNGFPEMTGHSALPSLRCDALPADGHAGASYSSIADREKTGLVRMSRGSRRMRSSRLRLSCGSAGVRTRGRNHGPFGRKRLLTRTDRGSSPTDLATALVRPSRDS